LRCSFLALRRREARRDESTQLYLATVEHV
jgi:hypothetical protein